MEYANINNTYIEPNVMALLCRSGKLHFAVCRRDDHTVLM